MKKLVILLGILSFIISINAQDNETINKIDDAYKSGQLDYEEALLQKFYAGFAKDKLSKDFYVATQSPMKCATHLIAEFRQNSDKLSDETKSIIEELITPSVSKKGNSITAESYISPYGKFELTYSLTGTDAVRTEDLDNNGVPDYVERVAEYFDHSWRVLIDTLGFKPIPLGVGEYYQVSFENMDYYGYTSPDGSNAMTEIVMHNTYQGFPSNTDPDGNVLGAAKVTAVHEFKHAIQILYNGWGEPGWFIEADATWSEDIGFDLTNDYYNYLGSSQIREPGRGLQQGDGYEDNLFFHFYTEKYSVNTNREIWERRELFNESVFSSVANMLDNYNASFDSSFTEYFTWLYNCGNRFDENLPGFQEGASYPTSMLCTTISTLPAENTGCDRDALSGNFLVYNSQSQNQFFQLLLDTPSGNNLVAVVILKNDNSASIEYYELDNVSTFDLFFQPKLSEIEKIIVIPVVTSASGSSFDYDYSFDAFQTAIFDHTPFVDTESTGDLEFILNLETPQDLAYTDSLKLFYQIDGGGYMNVPMLPTGNPNEYSATVNNPGDDVQIDYYFRIADQLDLQSFYPESAPDSTFSFNIGSDTQAPEIVHNSLTGTAKYNFPLYIYAEVSDNIGLDSVYIQYRLNEGNWMRSDMTDLGNDFYVYKLVYTHEQLSDGDLIDYKITAVDVSSNHNSTVLPETDFYSINISDGFYFFSNPNLNISKRQIFLLPSIDTLSVPEDISISDINVYFESDHPQFSDLEIRLYSPDGTEFKLYNQNWIGTNLENAGSPEIIFDSDAFLSVDNAILFDTLIAAGTFRPVDSDLSQLNSSSSQGNWILKFVDKGSNPDTGKVVEWGLIIKGEGTTDVNDDEDNLVKEYQLYQNYPNPFNPTTRIKYQVSSSEMVSLKVYDAIGREVATLVNDVKPVGTYEVEFNASNLASGIYLVRMTGSNFNKTKKIMLLK